MDSSADREQWGEHYQPTNGVDPCIRGSLKRFSWNQGVFCDLKFYFVDPQEVKGGEGANFLVTWQAEQNVNQPIIEAVMLNLYNRQGMVFRCPGKIICTHKE